MYLGMLSRAMTDDEVDYLSLVEASILRKVIRYRLAFNAPKKKPQLIFGQSSLGRTFRFSATGLEESVTYGGPRRD